jgi:hypothetical protein
MSKNILNLEYSDIIKKVIIFFSKEIGSQINEYYYI